MIFESAACSRMFALHPITRLDANVGVNIAGGSSHVAITTPAVTALVFLLLYGPLLIPIASSFFTVSHGDVEWRDPSLSIFE